MTLYRKEMWRVMRSVLYLLMMVGIVIFANSQAVFPHHDTIYKHEPGARSYGQKPSGNPELIMPEAAGSLFAGYSANEYITYPYGFAKNVKLSHADRMKMAEIIAELSTNGIPNNSQESNNTTDTGSQGIQIDGGNLNVDSDGQIEVFSPERNVPIDFHINPDITWERFSGLMKQADNLLGGGSDFSEKWINHRFGNIPVTYEETLADYELTVTRDKLSGAHARLFSDYMGIIMGLLPIFPAVFLCLRDRKTIVPMLYTRNISSARFILPRYFALLTAAMLPVFFMGVILTGTHAADYGFANIDILAYFKYAFFWVLPTVMTVTALGLFFTTLTGSPLVIAIQVVWWFVDMAGGSGSYSFFGVQSPFQLIPRHNALGQTGIYVDYLPKLIQNRLWISLAAVLLLAATICVFDARRRGLLNVNMFKRGKVQSAA